MDRPICNACNRRFVAINYINEGKKHYRTRCDSCIRKNRKAKTPVPRWQIDGYKKKKHVTVADLLLRAGHKY